MPIPPDSTVATTLSLAILSRPEIQGIDGSALDSLCAAIAEVITATIKEGTVNAVGTAPAGGGPVAVVGAVT